MLDLDQHLHISTTVEDLANGAPPLKPEDRQAGMAEGEPTNHRVTTGLNEAALCEMQHRLLDSEENERQRLAQELHDGPLQELHSLDFKLVAMARQLSDTQQQAQLSEMRSTLRQLARHLRDDLPGSATACTDAFWRERRAPVICRSISTEPS